MYWCPFCETLNKATADDLIEAGEQGKKYKYTFRLCPDDQGKTLADFIESKGGLPWLEHVAELYGVEATPKAVAGALDAVLGYNFLEQFAVFETGAKLDHAASGALGMTAYADAKGIVFKEHITELDGETLDPPLDVTSPVVGANTGGAKPCPELLKLMQDKAQRRRGRDA